MHLSTKLVAAVFALGLAAGPAFAADPTGVWQSTTGEARYNVSYCGDGTQLCAKLTWLRDDARTPENLAYLNQYVVHGASAVDGDTWQGSLSYQGDIYKGSLDLAGDTMRLKGCKAVFCKSMQFVRV